MEVEAKPKENTDEKEVKVYQTDILGVFFFNGKNIGINKKGGKRRETETKTFEMECSFHIIRLYLQHQEKKIRRFFVLLE